MGDLSPVVDQGISELQDRPRSNLVVLDGPKPSIGFGWRSLTCDKSSILQELLNTGATWGRAQGQAAII